MAVSSRNGILFLKAKTEKELSRLFLQYQIKTSRQYDIINIYPDKDGVVIWFRAFIDKPIELLSGK